MSIPEGASELPLNDSVIPEQIAQLSQQEDDPESSPFLISFAKYNEKECGIDNLEKKRALKALRLIKKVGCGIFEDTDLGNFKSSSIIPKGDYLKLYKGLHDDVEVRELFIDTDKGRIFFYTLKRIFYLVSVTDAHYNTR